MENLPVELRRVILTKVLNDVDRARVRSVSREFRHIIDDNAPVTDQNRYVTIRALGLDKTLSLFLRRSVVASRKKKLIKQYRTWLREKEVTFIHHVNILVSKLHGRTHKKLLCALHKDTYTPTSNDLGLLDQIRRYIDSRIELEMKQ